MSKMMKSLSTILLASAALLLPGLASAQNYPDSVKQYVASVKKQVNTINMDQFKAGLDQKSSEMVKTGLEQKSLGLIVDVREPDEFAEGHIPGAINIPRGLIEFDIWTEVGYPTKTDMNRQMTLYCKTGGRCALAAKSLKDLGFTNVTAVDMKIEDWKKAGHPLVKK
jgi:rhodanese-related sulfurtransferase